MAISRRSHRWHLSRPTMPVPTTDGSTASRRPTPRSKKSTRCSDRPARGLWSKETASHLPLSKKTKERKTLTFIKTTKRAKRQLMSNRNYRNHCRKSCFRYRKSQQRRMGGRSHTIQCKWPHGFFSSSNKYTLWSTSGWRSQCTRTKLLSLW